MIFLRYFGNIKKFNLNNFKENNKVWTSERIRKIYNMYHNVLC
jgi:hypothetical protein